MTNYKLVWYNRDAEDERKTTVGGEKIEEARINQIIRLAYKSHIKKDMALRDIQRLKRNIGNSLNKPEMKSINVTKEEALEVSRILFGEIFEELMAGLKA